MRLVFLAVLFLTALFASVSHASPKGLIVGLSQLLESAPKVSKTLPEDILEKLGNGKTLTDDELEEVKAFIRYLDSVKLKDKEVQLLDAQGKPFAKPDAQLLAELRLQLAPQVDDFIRDVLMSRKTELNKEAIAAEFSKRLAVQSVDSNLKYAFDITSGELSVAVVRPSGKITGRVQLYDKLIAAGIVVLGYQTLQDKAEQPDVHSDTGKAKATKDEDVAMVFVLLLSAVVCALWALYTGRSALLWFVLGLFLNVFAWICMLYLARRDVKKAGQSHSMQ